MLKKYHSEINIKRDPQKGSNIFNRLSADDFIAHPELKRIINYQKKASYEFLSQEETKPISTKNITDEKKFNFIQALNSFRQNYFDYCKEEAIGLHNYNKVHKENDEFTERFQKVFKENNDKMRSGRDINCLNDIQGVYEKKNYKLPQMSVEHNIFKENPLLLGEADLYKFYFFQKGNPQTKENSYNYLNKLNDQVFSKATAKKAEDPPNEELESAEQLKQYNLLCQELQANKDEIEKTTKMLENIEDFDDFFITKHNFNVKSNAGNSENAKNEILVINEEERSPKAKESLTFLPLISTTRKTSKKILYDAQSLGLQDNVFNKSNRLSQLDIEKQNNLKKSLSLSKTPLESLYEDIKNIELRNTPSPLIKDYLHSQRLYIPNDKSVKGMYRQLQMIKDKFIRKDYINDNLTLKGYKQGAKNTPEEDLLKIHRTKKLENRLMLNEKLLIKIAFNGKKQ